MEITAPPEEGRVLLVNKPLQWTSFDVVNKLRYKLKMKKIGHAGTLDPLATGLLIICTGKFTKRIEEFQAQEKEYTGEFVIGQTTPSHDLETEVSQPVDYSHISEEQLYAAAKKLTGQLQQIPPLHSAIKVDGKRAYKFARKGKEVELKPREVTVSVFEITKIQIPVICFRIICSKGTYIRSLVRDFGNDLRVGAYLSSLCRTRIGDFKLADAKTLEEIE
ncbi:MAG: tRNA pseudouridine(55) synthase TruB [Bacteroidota bacterium]|jgi:tRNA pseudouridine55 synthase|nr:tRNA pseudouridine(55) synthase TruB [Cytophagales bacterium]MCE2955778.1 tRNA pseudouridine(55) synthase TruB [Flammeovirgaceae bacterium]MCZ8069874.1 tRNA pseudouridine(55) synthase TruB [Cytophagales bacterium]